MSRKVILLVFGIVFFTGVTVAYFILSEKKNELTKLPVFNPNELNTELVDKSQRSVTKDHKVDDFLFYNQEGKKVTLEDVKNKVYVADFFFTTCPGICPKMKKQMSRVYEEFNNRNDFILLSHTVMPEVDSVEVMAEFAKKQGAVSEKWMFLTGEKKEIYRMARQSYFAVKTKGDGGPDDFIHTENFILVDKNQRLRGFYDGTSTEDVDRLIQDIYTLYKEYETK
jgi:protein SCO1/2